LPGRNRGWKAFAQGQNLTTERMAQLVLTDFLDIIMNIIKQSKTLHLLLSNMESAAN